MTHTLCLLGLPIGEISEKGFPRHLSLRLIAQNGWWDCHFHLDVHFIVLIVIFKYLLFPGGTSNRIWCWTFTHTLWPPFSEQNFPKLGPNICWKWRLWEWLQSYEEDEAIIGIKRCIKLFSLEYLQCCTHFYIIKRSKCVQANSDVCKRQCLR